MHVYMHVCVCMYACMHACLLVCMHACTYVCMYVCVNYSLYNSKATQSEAIRGLLHVNVVQRDLTGVNIHHNIARK